MGPNRCYACYISRHNLLADYSLFLLNQGDYLDEQVDYNEDTGEPTRRRGSAIMSTEEILFAYIKQVIKD